MKDSKATDLREIAKFRGRVDLRRARTDGSLVHARAHKQRLCDLIDKHGGVSDVARKTGIPQPSLSRMLNSGSMPRKSTLYKIANALGQKATFLGALAAAAILHLARALSASRSCSVITNATPGQPVKVTYSLIGPLTSGWLAS